MLHFERDAERALRDVGFGRKEAKIAVSICKQHFPTANEVVELRRRSWLHRLRKLFARYM